MKGFRHILLVFALLWVRSIWAGPSPMQQVGTLDVNVTRPIRLSYLLFLPAAYPKDLSVHWPLILYLHGGSLRGNSVDRLRTLGLPHRLESDPDFPCVVVSPQCSEGEIWSDADAIAALLDRVALDYRIDPERVYITGHSMGGRGALYFAYRMPTRFAAVLALSPVSPVNAWADGLAKIPLWVIQGDKDMDAPIAETRDLINATVTAGGQPHLSVLGGRDHFILDVYDRPGVWEWLLGQKRGVPHQP